MHPLTPIASASDSGSSKRLADAFDPIWASSSLSEKRVLLGRTHLIDLHCPALARRDRGNNCSGNWLISCMEICWADTVTGTCLNRCGSVWASFYVRDDTRGIPSNFRSYTVTFIKSTVWGGGWLIEILHYILLLNEIYCFTYFRFLSWEQVLLSIRVFDEILFYLFSAGTKGGLQCVLKNKRDNILCVSYSEQLLEKKPNPKPASSSRFNYVAKA